MDITAIESQLKDIDASIDVSSSLLKLQQLLGNQENVITLLDQTPTRIQLKSICKKLQKTLLQSSIYHLILSLDSKSKSDILESGKCKALLDLEGNFIWWDDKCAKLFKIVNLEAANLFRLMDKQSLNSIYSKHGKALLKGGKPIVIKYRLNDGITLLTSRCTVIIKRAAYNRNEPTVLIETRLAKRCCVKDFKLPFTLSSSLITNSPAFCYYSDLCAFSPFNPHQFAQLEKIYPSNYSNKKHLDELEFSFGDTPMEKLKLSPFLVADPLTLCKKAGGLPHVKDFIL
ncbi:unnamed protein product [Blepharisma stoltei]|uniref:Uncharacterized protein n=1 Tax=Blepharisma stoltei TaxID=1481888 RepID=A0AAU9JDD8_9CILI|nr:unnamed protein product [Blepharisma stoltei]